MAPGDNATYGFSVSKTLNVDFRDNGFWAFDVVSAVFLKHLIDATASHLEHRQEPWLTDAVSRWRFNAVCGDAGLFLDKSWSAEQIFTFTDLALEACLALSKREKILAHEIESWQMIDGDNGRCFARGLPAVTTASAIRLGEAIIKLVNGTLPAPPYGTWWLFATENDGTTLRKRGESMEIWQGQNYIKVEAVDRVPDNLPLANDVKLSVEVAWEQFSGHGFAWVAAPTLAVFLVNLRELEARRQGEAALQGISPEEFRLRIWSIDRRGHMAMGGLVSKRVHLGEKGPYRNALEFAFEFDPTLLPNVVTGFQSIAEGRG